MSQRAPTQEEVKQYYLITNVAATTDTEIELKSASWQEPYTIDDEDLTFDGKPLNLLYEENRWVAEHSKKAEEVKEKTHRGRSRHSKK